MASSRRFAGGEGSPQEAGRQLRVGRIVTGHFSMHQSELRVTVEAVEVDGNRLLWRDTIAAPTADSIALRDRLTSRIRDGLLPALGAAAPTAAHARPRNAEAYDIYLKSLAISSDPGPNRTAIAMLERASTIDPDHADTWASLGRRYYDEGQYGSGGSEAFRRSEAALRQALALDPAQISAAVRLLGLQVDAGRLQDGYDIARSLVARRPDSGESHFALAYVLRYGGLLEDSARECDAAVSRDPTNPVFRTCSATFIQLGRYDRALDFVRLDSGSEWSRLVTRWVYQRLGRRDDAREQHRLQSPDYPRGFVPASFHGFITRCLSGAVPTGAGRLSEDDVRTFLILRDSEPLYFFAGDLAYCGDSAAALRLLRESIARNYCASSAIEIDPAFAAIRNSAEYGELLDRGPGVPHSIPRLCQCKDAHALKRCDLTACSGSSRSLSLPVPCAGPDVSRALYPDRRKSRDGAIGRRKEKAAYIIRRAARCIRAEARVNRFQATSARFSGRGATGISARSLGIISWRQRRGAPRKANVVAQCASAAA